MAKKQVKQSNIRRVVKRVKRNVQACLGVMCATLLLVAALPMPSDAVGEGTQDGPAQANPVVVEAPSATPSDGDLPDDALADAAAVSDGASLNVPDSDVAPPDEPAQEDFPMQPSSSQPVEGEASDPQPAEGDEPVQDGYEAPDAGAAPDDSNELAPASNNSDTNENAALNAVPFAGDPEANEDGAFADENDPAGFAWIFSDIDANTCKITGYTMSGAGGGTVASGTVHVPATNNGKRVVAITGNTQGKTFENLKCQIDFSAATNLERIDTFSFGFAGLKGSIDFSKCAKLTNLTAFSFKGAAGITGLVLPPNIATIGNYAFQDCTALTGGLTLPKSLKSLGSGAFLNCQFTSLVIPNDTALTVINASAFENNALTGSLALPASITTVGASAFGNTEANKKMNKGNLLTNVTFMANSVDVGSKAFQWNAITNNPFASNTMFTGMGDYAFEGNNLSGAISLEKFVPSVLAKGVIANNPLITKLALSPQWLYIPDNSFKGLTNLTELVIPSGNQIHRIGASAFQDCTSLRSINLNNAALQDTGNGIAIGNSAFQGCTSLKEFHLGTGTFGVLQVGFTVGYRAFKDCGNFTFIDIPSSDSTKVNVKLDAEAFMNTNLGEFPTVDENGVHYDKPLGYIPLDRRTITSIGQSAFENANISDIRLPNSLAFVGARAFAKNHVTNLELPRNGNLDTPGNVGENVLAEQTVTDPAIWGDSAKGDGKADVELEALHALGLVHSRVDAVGLNSSGQTNRQPDNSGTWMQDHVATYDKDLVTAQNATFTYGYQIWRTGGSKALSHGTVTLSKIEKGVPFKFNYYDNADFSGTPDEHVQWVGVGQAPVEESHGVANFGLDKPGYSTQPGAYTADTNAGWRNVATGSPIDPETVIAQDTFSTYEYYNRWLPHTYSVTFDNNWAYMVGNDPQLGKDDADGTTVPDDAWVSGATAGLAGLTYGEPATLPDNGFTMGGYEFVGWATSPDLGETPPVEGSNFFSPGTKTIATPDPAPAEGGTVTLYAQWKAVDLGDDSPALLGFLSIPQHVSMESSGGRLYSQPTSPDAGPQDHAVVVSAEAEAPGATWPADTVYQVSVTRPNADAPLLALSGGDDPRAIDVLLPDGQGGFTAYDPGVNDADNPGAVPTPLMTIDPHDDAKSAGSFILRSVDPIGMFEAGVHYAGTMTFRVDTVQKGAAS